MTTVSVGRMKAFTKAATLYCATMLWMLASTGGAFGQQSSASVTGLVKDASGANIPAAQVRLRNIETNVSRETVSNDTGNYTFLNVPPGKYTLDFSAQGFQLEAVTAFELNVNQTPVHSVDAREASILLSTHLFRQA